MESHGVITSYSKSLAISLDGPSLSLCTCLWRGTAFVFQPPLKKNYVVLPLHDPPTFSRLRVDPHSLQAAALYTQAGDYQKTARFYYKKAEDTYYQANNWASYDDWRRARDQWDYFYSRNVRQNIRSFPIVNPNLCVKSSRCCVATTCLLTLRTSQR